MTKKWDAISIRVRQLCCETQWKFLPIHEILLIALAANRIESVAAVKKERRKTVRAIRRLSAAISMNTHRATRTHIHILPLAGCRLHFDALIFQSAFFHHFHVFFVRSIRCGKVCEMRVRVSYHSYDTPTDVHVAHHIAFTHHTYDDANGKAASSACTRQRWTICGARISIHNKSTSPLTTHERWKNTFIFFFVVNFSNKK